MSIVAHRPKKRLGQHFLHDPWVTEQIIAAINPQRDDFMIEIGPGKGALTAPLIGKVASFSAIELDRDLVAGLSRQFPSLTVYQQDALKFNFSELAAAKIRIIGNLPYNISIELILYLLKYKKIIHDMIFMLQKEVADRICAGPTSRGYGRLSVMCQTYYRVQRLFTVSPKVFSPPPKVESAVMKFVPLAGSGHAIGDENHYANLVKQAFSQRRKTIRNALKMILNDSDFEYLSIAPDNRAENLAVEDYVKLANYSGNGNRHQAPGGQYASMRSSVGPFTRVGEKHR